MHKLCSTLLCLLFVGCFFGEDDSDSEVCFIGDSITYLWDLEFFFPTQTIIKHAVSGAIVQDFDKWDLSDCEGKRTVVLIGTNNVSNNHIEDSSSAGLRTYFVREYQKRVYALHADPLIAVSILPRNEFYEQDSSVNMNIQALNREIQDSLHSMDIRYEYIDVFDKFIKTGYEIKRDFFKDGLHPNEAGYEILAREIGKKL